MKQAHLLAAIALLSGCGSPTSIDDRGNAAWRLATSAPLAVYEAQGAVVGGRVYVFGGSLLWATLDALPAPVADREARRRDTGRNHWWTQRTACDDMDCHTLGRELRAGSAR